MGALMGLLAASPVAFAQSASEHLGPAAPSNLAMTGSAAAQPSDASLTHQVKQALKGDQSTMNAKIRVSAKEGVVTLSGDVDSKAMADHALQVVASVAGVKSVDNELRYPEHG